MYGMAHDMRTGLAVENCGSANIYFFHLSKLNAMLNLFLYYSRHREIRLAIHALFCRQKADIKSGIFGSSHHRV
jgi:hypothetical protein